MATAHSLATINGKLSGDPIDLKMFLGTGWVCVHHCVVSAVYIPLLPQILKEPPPGSFDTLTPTLAHPPGDLSGGLGGTGVELAQLRQFTFSSELQRMSVLVSDSLFSCFHVSIFPFPGASGSIL